MTTRQRKKLAIIGFSGALLLSFLVLFKSETAYALSFGEPVFRVLKDDPIGIKDKWKRVLDAVNYIVVAYLIFIAFAQILRLNINTYSFKKTLPNLVLAVIAANFSYLICRLLIDIANVVISFLINPEISTLTDGFNWYNKAQTRILRDPIMALMYIIFTLVGTVMIYITAYLLYIRNWIIYFLVPLAPLAFMSMVLPQTKSIFNQWWSNFLKWVFMPVVSIFWLWLGTLWTSNITDPKTDSTAEFMKLVFAIACFYLAMTTPFKMGGPIMAKWGGLGQKLWGGTVVRARKAWIDPQVKTFGVRQWNNWRELGLNMERQGKTPFRQWLGRHWLGTGKDKIQANLSHEDARAKGLTEGFQARHYYRRGPKLQMEREYTKNRGGEIGEFEKYALADIIEAGLKNKDDSVFRLLQKFRSGSAVAGLKMQASDAAYESLKDNMIQEFVRRDFGDISKRVVIGGKELTFDERMTSLGFMKEGATTAMTDQEALPIREAAIAEWNSTRQDFQAFTTRAAEYKEGAAKEWGDVAKLSRRDRPGLHNVAEFNQIADRLQHLTRTLGPDFLNGLNRFGNKFAQALSASGQNQQDLVQAIIRERNLNVQDQAVLNQRVARLSPIISRDQTAARNLTNVDRDLANFEKAARDMKIVMKGQDIFSKGGKLLDKMIERAQADYAEKLEQINNKKFLVNGQIPLAIRDMVQVNQNGKAIGIKTLPGRTANRDRVWIDRDIREKASEWSSEYGIPTLASALAEGKLATENLGEQEFRAAMRGEVNRDVNGNDLRRAEAVVIAVKEAIATGPVSQRQAALDGWLRALNKYGMKQEIMDMILNIAQDVGGSTTETDKNKEFYQFTQKWQTLLKTAQESDPNIDPATFKIDREEDRTILLNALDLDNPAIQTMLGDFGLTIQNTGKNLRASGDIQRFAGAVAGEKFRFGDYRHK